MQDHSFQGSGPRPPSVLEASLGIPLMIVFFCARLCRHAAMWLLTSSFGGTAFSIIRVAGCTVSSSLVWTAYAFGSLSRQ